MAEHCFVRCFCVNLHAKPMIMKKYYCSGFWPPVQLHNPRKKVISLLYVYELASGKSSLILKEKRHFEAPNWSRDGKFLLINASGKLEKISPTGEKIGPLTRILCRRPITTTAIASMALPYIFPVEIPT